MANEPSAEVKDRKAKRSRKKLLTVEQMKAELNGVHPSVQNEWLTSAAQLPTRELRWLLKPYLPFGSVVGVTGPTGVGKSSFVAAVVASVTGGPLMGPEQQKRPAKWAMYFILEEDPSLMVRPRLEAAGACLPNVCFPGYNLEGRLARRLSLPRDAALLEKWIRELKAELVVFDPVNSFLDENLNGSLAEHVRPLMDRLAAIAAATDALILAVMHPRKGKEGDAIDWVSGSPAWTQGCRMVLQLGRHPTQEGRNVLAVPKPGIIKAPGSRLYAIEPGEHAGRFVLGSPCEVEAYELAGGKQDKVDMWKRDVAKDVLREELEDGEKPVKLLVQRCNEMGIDARTLQRAAKDMGVPRETRREGDKNITYFKKPAGGFAEAEGQEGG